MQSVVMMINSVCAVLWSTGDAEEEVEDFGREFQDSVMFFCGWTSKDSNVILALG
jgi:hypothetical protein